MAKVTTLAFLPTGQCNHHFSIDPRIAGIFHPRKTRTLNPTMEKQTRRDGGEDRYDSESEM